MTAGTHGELLSTSAVSLAADRLPIQAPTSLTLIMGKCQRSNTNKDVLETRGMS